MTKVYKVSINGAEVEQWGTDGAYGQRFAKDYKESKDIQKESITKIDVLEAVTDMLYHSGKVTEEDLFDGNEDYFIFSRIEDGNGEEVTDPNEEGYYVSYFIDIELVENIRAIDI